MTHDFLFRLFSCESLAIVTLKRPQIILWDVFEGIMNQDRFAVGIIFMMSAGLIPWSSMAAESRASAEKVAKEARETIEATRDYTAQQKEAFQRKAHEELVAIQRQLIGLRQKVTEASESTRVELQKSLDELEKKKDGVKKKVDELKGATDAKWHDVREGMNDALNDLKRSYQTVLSRMP
jgi:hypothetical protein